MMQLLLKMIMSVNHLSLYEAIANMIQGLREDLRALGKPVALDHVEQQILSQSLSAEVQVDDERQGKPIARLRAKI